MMPMLSDKDFHIIDSNGRLTVRFEPGLGLPEYAVDFTDPTLLYRIRKGGGRTQAIAKAVGIKKGRALPTVLDHTAGFGRDAFVLAALGCRVHMLEKCPAVRALLADGLRRAATDSEIGHWVTERLSLQDGDAPLPFAPQTVYLDPMYTARKKSAAVKKELQVLRALAGDEDLTVALFDQAMALAAERVVIKRPASAAFIIPQKPDGIVETPNHRFEIYKRMTCDALK